jgi:pSer/pThr/pTyr-binding forkhead associated (FHA) protein
MTEKVNAREAVVSEANPALVFEESGEVVPIVDAGIIAGRSPECNLRLDDNTVSKKHAKVVRQGEQCLVVDLGSTNGTYVNGVQVASHLLSDGDHVRFASVAFRFRARPSFVLEPGAPDRRQTRLLEQLRRLSAEVLTLESERAILRAATDFLVDRLTSDRVLIAFRRTGREDPDIALIRTRPTLEKKHQAAPVAHTPIKHVMRTGKTYCPTITDDNEATTASMRGASLGSILVMPLIARGKVLGAIQAERFEDEHGAYDEIDVLCGEIVASLVASQVETARLYRYAPKGDAAGKKEGAPAPAAAAGPEGALPLGVI